jgi:hypothetical protein
MKTKIFFSMVLVTVILPLISISQDRFSYGCKGGIGLWRYEPLEESTNIVHPMDYPSTMGFSIGLCIQYKLSEEFFLVNELSYQNSTVQSNNLYTGYEGILDQKVTMQYLIVPILLKYKPVRFWDIYFFGGPGLGYLINAKYFYYDHIYSGDRGNREITKDLPTFNTAIEYGIGKEITISNSIFYLELRAQSGLTKYHINEFFNRKWNNDGIMFFVGYKI